MTNALRNAIQLRRWYAMAVTNGATHEVLKSIGDKWVLWYQRRDRAEADAYRETMNPTSATSLLFDFASAAVSDLAPRDQK